MKNTAIIVALFLPFALSACGKKDASAKAAAAQQDALKQYGFDIHPAAQKIGEMKAKEVGNITLYRIASADVTHDVLVKYYKAQMDATKLQHGSPYPQKLTLDGASRDFTGIGGMDFSVTINFFVSKPEQGKDQLLAAQAIVR